MIAGGKPAARQRIEDRRQPVPLLRDLHVPVGNRLHVLEMAVIGLHAVVAELRQLGDARRQRQRLRRRCHAVTAHPHVDADQDADRPVAARMGGERLDAGEAVDQHHEAVGLLGRECEPGDHRRRHHRRGDEEAGQPRVGQHLRLEHGRAAEADRAGIDLPLADDAGLVRLGVGPDLASGLASRATPSWRYSPRTRRGRPSARASRVRARACRCRGR